MKKISVTVASLALLIAGAAHAQAPAANAPLPPPAGAGPQPGGPIPHPGRAGGFLAGADTNKDGKISLEEWKTFHSERIVKDFDRLDVDKDGFITDEDMEKVRAEFEAKRAKMGGPGAPGGAPPTPQQQVQPGQPVQPLQLRPQ